MENHPVLSTCQKTASVVLHGSLTLGFDDPWSDIDLWLLVSQEDYSAITSASDTTFFEFTLDGKKGHFSAHANELFARSIQRCEMDTIHQLRCATVLTDPTGQAANFIAMAQRPMREEVRNALFFYHYIEMRSDHRACATPIERGESVALLLFLPKVLAHALRAALILEEHPYPYDKWLYRQALETPTGKSLQPAVETILDALASDAIRHPGPETTHPVGLALREIRRILIQAAQEKGINEPWLNEWWLYIVQARQAIQTITW